jgi:hypothetical protein
MKCPFVERECHKTCRAYIDHFDVCMILEAVANSTLYLDVISRRGTGE